MPQVGNKHYPYTREGIRRAKMHAKRTGQSISRESNTNSRPSMASRASRIAPPGRRSSLLGSKRRSRRRNASPLSRMSPKKRYV